MFGKDTPSCRFCTNPLEPEAVHALAVPFFDRTYEVCRRCRDDFHHGGRELIPFDPAFRGDRTFRLVGPLASDARLVLSRAHEELGAKPDATPPRALLERVRGAIEDGSATELDLAEGLAAAIVLGEELAPSDGLLRLVDRKARGDAVPLLLGLHAHAVAGTPPPGDALPRPPVAPRAALLEVARRAYLQYLPFSLKTELDARIAALHALATLEHDAGAATQRLRTIRAQAELRPALREPRVPLVEAFLHVALGHFGAADKDLAQSLAWARGHAEPAPWQDVEAAALHDTYVRAVAGGRFPAAKDALKAYVKLRPDDRRALMALAHVFTKVDLDPVAREVLSSVHARDPKDEDGVILYGTCLSRIGDHEAAWRLLRDDLDHDRDDERLGAERRHLGGLAAHAVGRRDKALELLAQAYALAPEDASVRRNLVTVLLEEVKEAVQELTPESFPALLELLEPHRAALEKEHGKLALGLLRTFVDRELAAGFAPAPGFGPDDFGKLRFVELEGTLLQCLVALAQRRLPEAVQKDRQARGAGAPPVPLELLLSLLERLRSQREEWRVALGGGPREAE